MSCTCDPRFFGCHVRIQNCSMHMSWIFQFRTTSVNDLEVNRYRDDPTFKATVTVEEDTNVQNE